MFQPKYWITDKVLNNIVSFEKAVAKAELAEFSYEVRSKLTLQSKASNSFHLGHMLGANLTLKDAEKIADGFKLDQEDDQMRLLHNFRGLMEFNRSNVAADYQQINKSLLLHLNKLALTSWRESWQVKFRQEDTELDETLDSWVSWRAKDIAASATEKEVEHALDWFNQNAPSIHYVIRLGVLIYRMVEITPFVSGNRLTLLGLTDFVMTRSGVSASAFLPVIKMFDIHQQSFDKSWELGRKTFELTTWLEKFTEALSKETETSTEGVHGLVVAEREKSSRQPFLDLNKRQLKILKYLQNIPTVQREDYCQMMDVSTMTAYRDLNELVRKKLLRVDGQGRGTRYILASR